MKARADCDAFVVIDLRTGTVKALAVEISAIAVTILAFLLFELEYNWPGIGYFYIFIFSCFSDLISVEVE
jgi:hypothetical protein